MTVLALCLIVAALLAPTARASDTQSVQERIVKARQRTHDCQQTLGLRPTPVSERKVSGRKYQRWVLTLWSARARAYCRMARELTDVGVLRAAVNPCLASIIDAESGWQVTVWNHQGSGAYGLPQALPGNKMASAGDDWRTNPLTQLRWMASYAEARYGGACEALAFRNRMGWY